MTNYSAKIQELKLKQSWSLPDKIEYSSELIRQWYEFYDGQVYVSFSGGKDSTVLLHLVRSIYPEVPAVFIDTGLEFPEIRDFVKTIDNVTWIKPKMSFKSIIEQYGYPVISKETSRKIHEISTTNSDKLRQKRLYGDCNGNGKLAKKWQFLIDAPFKIHDYCCEVCKKRPSKLYEKQYNVKPMLGLMAQDSRLRTMAYCKYGCNAFVKTRPNSSPLYIWTIEDIWNYIKLYNIPFSNIYNLEYNHTGCMFCMFGICQDSTPNRFQKMKETHPEIWNYCIHKLNLKQVLDFISVPYE